MNVRKWIFGFVIFCSLPMTSADSTLHYLFSSSFFSSVFIVSFFGIPWNVCAWPARGRNHRRAVPSSFVVCQWLALTHRPCACPPWRARVCKTDPAPVFWLPPHLSAWWRIYSVKVYQISKGEKRRKRSRDEVTGGKWICKAGLFVLSYPAYTKKREGDEKEQEEERERDREKGESGEGAERDCGSSLLNRSKAGCYPQQE